MFANEVSTRRAGPSALLPVGLIALSLTLGSLGCSKTVMESQWREKDITVDGIATEWSGNLYELEDADLYVGFYNDESDLYLCLVPANETRERQFITQGFTLWLDPEGGKSKDWGIRFPLGLQGSRGTRQLPPGDTQTRERQSGPTGSGPRQQMPIQDLRRQLTQQLTNVELLGSATDFPIRCPRDSLAGIDLNVSIHDDVVMYEIRLPFLADAANPYTLQAAPGTKIGVGFELTAPELANMMERTGRAFPSMGGGGKGGGRGGGRGGGGRGGGGGGRSMPERPELPEHVMAWTQVTLAPSPLVATTADE